MSTTLVRPGTSRVRELLTNERFVVLLLVVLALLVFLPGTWWGLPHATAPDRRFAWGNDELAPLGPIAELYSVLTRSELFNPQYPLFGYVVQSLFVGPYVLFLWLTGGITHAATEYPYGLTDPVGALATMTLLARFSSILLAAGVVVGSYRTGSILWNRRAGMLSALLVLTFLPMFYYARTSNVDMGALFWTTCGLAVFATALKDGLTVRRALWLGLFAALATATKDPFYAPFVTMGLILAAREIWGARALSVREVPVWKPLVAGIVAGLAIYVIACGVLLHPQRYVTHIEFIAGDKVLVNPNGYFSRPATLAGYAGLAADVIGFVLAAVGIPAFACVVLGTVYCAIRRPEKLLFLLPAVAVFFGVIAPVRLVRFRFVFVIAFICLFIGAVGLDLLLRDRRKAVRYAGIAATAIVLGWSLFRGVDLTYQMRNDSRYETAGWFRAHSVPGDSVGYYGAPLKLPALDAGITTVAMPDQIGRVDSLDFHQVQPEFIIVVPQQEAEPIHEWSMPEGLYEDLVRGAHDYRQVAFHKTRPLLHDRLISFVNPPVTVFARTDVAQARGLLTGD